MDAFNSYSAWYRSHRNGERGEHLILYAGVELISVLPHSVAQVSHHVSGPRQSAGLGHYIRSSLVRRLNY